MRAGIPEYIELRVQLREGACALVRGVVTSLLATQRPFLLPLWISTALGRWCCSWCPLLQLVLMGAYQSEMEAGGRSLHHLEIGLKQHY